MRRNPLTFFAVFDAEDFNDEVQRAEASASALDLYQQLLRYVHAGARIFPVQVQSALAAGLVEANGEILHGRGCFGNSHRDARQIFTLTRGTLSVAPIAFADWQFL